MKQNKNYTFWFLTGSQHLYGKETLDQVEDQARQVVEGLNGSNLPFELVMKPVVTTSEEIYRVMVDANSDDACAGVVTWMHTFSPAKIWIHGLAAIQKPLLHFHTQYNQNIPWQDIDMDYMNLNQSAHGDREYGFIVSRMNIERKVIVGHWAQEEVQKRFADWMNTAYSHVENRNVKVARFGDNMRRVAVTEGDKVEAHIKFGWTVNGYGVGDLVEYINGFSDEEVNQLFKEYEEKYAISNDIKADADLKQSVLEQARIELGLKAFMNEGGYNAFTTTFEDLHGMKQLPGLAAQRLMEQGYGFAGEGDWKTAALLRTMKVMTGNKGTTFMEDYTYHFEPGKELVLGSHMLEICPTVANNQPEIQVHPLSIGGKADPARMVFDGMGGEAVNVSLVDLGHRFRLIINIVDAVVPTESTPNLPVAKLLWKPQPSLTTGGEAWIYAGGAHHTVLSFTSTLDQMLDWAALSEIEAVVIDKNTDLYRFRNELKWNEIVWKP
ncbi:L-arabinose isomerase [Evansella cellulosilytica]|uniref:L-arabinose isomerase n=1 Tax=Evansella cellulosilytica (strain ATCC 21833 / DSM 2522 / FERM P-1141 / JCM 9156 / N-4) TaxID=649639 RepID=E6TRV5_EVAC2|nr:L-arabinose isomerase [Evansella cellulosilytica]ADU29478.1 L-arabinose isomerase [Evansella cellulosilytica DSM 2522]